MKLESERVPETVATPELAAELLRDAERRGAWLVAKDDADDGRFVQVEESGDGFSLEWRAGSAAPLRRVIRPVSVDEAKSAFRAFLSGDNDWTARFDWSDQTDSAASAPTFARKGVPTFLVALVAAFLATHLVIGFELCFIGNCGSLSECLDPCKTYTELGKSAAEGKWSDLFSALLEGGLLSVPLIAAGICTAVCKKPWKAVLFAALAAAIVEVFWFFPFAAGCLC